MLRGQKFQSLVLSAQVNQQLLSHASPLLRLLYLTQSASEPPRKIMALPDLIAKDAASSVTFGRDS